MFEILKPLEPLRSYSSFDMLDSIYGFITGNSSIPTAIIFLVFIIDTDTFCLDSSHFFHTIGFFL